MVWLIRLVCSCLILHIVFSEEDSKLLLVQALFRHGDRAPLHLYPTDPNTKDSWPEGLGKLTLLGKKQQYALGKFLRSMYQDFITTNPSEVLVNSSAADRCITSAAATMASFYAPEGRWKFEDDLNWQPIPIHYLPPHQDKFLRFRAKCPRATEEMAKQRNSEEIQELFRKYQVQLEVVSNYSGLNIYQGISIGYLYDAIQIEKRYNLTIPDWAHLYWEEILEISISLAQSLIKSPIARRLRVGLLLQDIDQNLRKKVNGDLPDLKVRMYSTHDIIIAAVLLSLNFTNMPLPPYCATLLFELHEMTDASMTVRLLYLNSTDPLADMGEPHVLEVEGCSEFCPVENFTDKLRHLIPEDWEQECQLDATSAVET
ncbi:unnamed protein product [Larinioides sclopetarius]|uniref:Acid phosphatase n=1 Tax=Larinioides sclopetarius TaxID=280406 RepID=A0AAV2B5U0_9ARAC